MFLLLFLCFVLFLLSFSLTFSVFLYAWFVAVFVIVAVSELVVDIFVLALDIYLVQVVLAVLLFGVHCRCLSVRFVITLCVYIHLISSLPSTYLFRSYSSVMLVVEIFLVNPTPSTDYYSSPLTTLFRSYLRGDRTTAVSRKPS